MLDSEYFNTICSKQIDNIKYHVVKPGDNSMVLFSKIDNSPIACLHFLSKSAQTCVSKRTDNSKADYQCIINKDDKEIEFIITNLTEYVISFNILKENMTNLNAVNCLRKYESYSVKCDQDNNCKMILKAIKDENNSHVKVSNESKLKNNDSTYYHLSIVPENKLEIKNKLRETYWDCVDFFIMKEIIKPFYTDDLRNVPDANMRNIHDKYDGKKNGVNNKYDFSYMYDNINNIPDTNMRNIHDKLETSINDIEDLNEDMFDVSNCLPRESNSDWFEVTPEPINVKNKHLINITRPIGINTIGSSYRNPTYDLRGTIPNPKIIKSPWLESSIEPDLYNNSYLEEELSTPAGSYEKNRERVKKAEHDRKKKSLEISLKKDNEVVLESKLGKIHQGEKMTENLTECKMEFDFDITSIPCKISLSINENLVFKNYIDWNKDAQEFLENFLNKDSTLLNNIKKIYKSDTCSICLEENSNDMIFYQCGHQCCHYECGKNLSKCPMCRKIIGAYIKT